jgi:hypothetical protein
VPASRVDIPRELAVVPVPTGGQDTHLEQFREMQAKLDEEAGRLVQLRQNIEQEWAGRALAGGVKGKCALGPFLSILVIECQRKCFCVNL